VPRPFDQHVPWDAAVDPARSLSPFREAVVLSAFPPGARVVDARATRRHYKPDSFPVRVRVAVGDGERTVMLRMDSGRGGVEREAAVLPVLRSLGLPVPEVLAGPMVDPDHPGGGAMTVITVVPGDDLQTLSHGADAGTLARLSELLLDAVDRLRDLTPVLLADPLGAVLPRASLSDELDAIVARGGPPSAPRSSSPAAISTRGTSWPRAAA
jgi:hypothetical protein